MKRTKKSSDDFKQNWKSYVLQSVFAALTVFIVFLLLSLYQLAIVASIGASAFIVFAMPKSVAARAKNILGGYCVGLLCGLFSALIPHAHHVSSAFVASFAVGLSMLVMVITDTEHPPAAGIALGVAIRGFSWGVMVTSLVSVFVLTVIHYLCRDSLKDLV